jgi:protein CpxP
MKRILVLLLLALPMLAQDQPRPRAMRPGGGGQHGAMMPRMHGPMDGKWWNNTELAKKLNLTDQQVQQMEQIFQQHRLKLIDQRAVVEKAEVTLQPMLEADRPDETQVLAQIDKVAQARAELEKSNARMLLGIRQVLTADQWKQLKSDMPHARRMSPDGFGGRGGRRGPDGPPPTPPPSEE